MDVSVILLVTAVVAVTTVLVAGVISVPLVRNTRKLAKITDYHIFHLQNIDNVPNLLKKQNDALTDLTDFYSTLLQNMPEQIAAGLLAKPELLGLFTELIPHTSTVSGDRSQARVDDSEQVVREISHALSTPLAQIEALALILERSTSYADVERAEDIQRSIHICKSFLTAFRELHSVAAATASWNPNSLQQVISASCEVYKKRTGSGARIEVTLPDTISGYSNSFICAVLLPLIQNAVELDKGVAPVVISYERDAAEFNRLLVASTPVALPESDKIYSPGYSTKLNHEGLGLPTVSRLISGNRQSSLTHGCAGDRVTFIIKLPARRQ